MQEESSLRMDTADGVTLVGFRDASILDMNTIQRVSRELYRLVEAGDRPSVVLDFSGVRFLSSQALGVLLTLRRKADAASVRVVLVGLRPELARVFRIANLDKLFVFFDTREAAIAHFNPQ